jgi:hypothetical protein
MNEVYQIGQKVRYAPHHPGDIWDTQPWVVYARVERWALTHEGCLLEYELTPWPYTLFVSNMVAVCVRLDMLAPWPEEE